VRTSTSVWPPMTVKPMARLVPAPIPEETTSGIMPATKASVVITQENLDIRVEVTQSQFSKLERREDHRISTVRRYVEALGGQLEILVPVGGSYQGTKAKPARLRRSGRLVPQLLLGVPTLP
jgi:hypothetical protein